MTIYEVMQNLMEMQRNYQMNTKEKETIHYAIGYLENLKVFIEKIDGLSEEWKEKAIGTKK